MDYWPMLLAFLAGALGIYYYCFKGLHFFQRYNIPYISPLPCVGNVASLVFALRPMANIVKDAYDVNREAKYVGFFDFMTPIIMIRDPDLIKSIAIKNFEHFVNHRVFIDESSDPLIGKNLFALHDEKWKDVRTLLSPAFTSSKMRGMFKLMSECAASFSEYMARLPEEEKEMEMKDSFARYTNDVIATCAFGITVDSMRNRNNEFYLMGRAATQFGFIRSMVMFFMRSFPGIAKLMGLKFIGKKEGDFFKTLIETTMRTRDEKGIVRPDMLQLMMDSRGKRGEGKELTIEDITAQAFIFFFGGLDTTSTTMCFAAHEIAVNPDVQEKLQKEIDEVLEQNDGELIYDAINRMDYLDAVVNETLRMYPIAVFLDRVCSKDFELPPTLPGCTPFKVEKGMYIWFPAYGLHHDPKYFENPDKFNPDRFVNKNFDQSAYIPFGLGPRMCIGNRFALLEIKVMLFHLLARCDLKPCTKTAIPMKLTRKSFNMQSENGYWMKVQPRTNPSKTLRKTVDNGSSA